MIRWRISSRKIKPYLFECADFKEVRKHIGLGRHRNTARCDKQNQMRLRRKDVEIGDRGSDETFSLTWEEEAERIEGVSVFKYIRRILDRLDHDWPEVLCNIRKERHVWERIGKFLRREGAEPEFFEKFYCTVVQAVLLFGAETWVFLTPIMQRLEGAYVGFLRQATRKRQRG